MASNANAVVVDNSDEIDSKINMKPHPDHGTEGRCNKRKGGPEDADVGLLANAVDALDCLVIDGRVPPRLQEHHLGAGASFVELGGGSRSARQSRRGESIGTQ